jgi:hypothetical protein
MWGQPPWAVPRCCRRDAGACSTKDHDVRLTEVGALGEYWFAGRFGQGIYQAVAEIEGGGVVTFSVSAPRGTSEVGLFGVHGDDLQTRADDEEIELAAGGFPLPGFQNDSSFEHSAGGDQARSGSGNRGEKFLTFRLGEENGSEGGRVDNHLGLAREAVLVVAHNFVRRTGIEDWQSIHAAEDLLELTGEDMAPALLLEPVQAFFESLLDGPGQRFTSPFGNFARQPFGFHALDTKCHNESSIP